MEGLSISGGILMLYFNKEKNAFYINCACGCEEALTFRIVPPYDEKDTDYAFITYSRGSFYAEQNTILDMPMIL